MSKPKNRVICPDCGRAKMLFETESKANLFIKYNGEEICEDTSKLRVYYCPSCCGYHISSKPVNPKGYHHTEKLIKAYYADIANTDNKEKLPEPENETIAKIIEQLWVMYKSGIHTFDLQKYIKIEYSDKLTGKEREYIFKKIIEKKKDLKKITEKK